MVLAGIVYLGSRLRSYCGVRHAFVCIIAPSLAFTCNWDSYAEQNGIKELTVNLPVNGER